MAVQAAGTYRRTPLERSDQRVAWKRGDQAFFAAGACHILAWTCRDAFPTVPIGLAAIRFTGQPLVFHTYATWDGWAFDHSGWNPEADLLRAIADFEGHGVERVEITSTLAEFCAEHRHRMPSEFWRDPRPRARAYVARSTPPWGRGPESS